jgi:pimeloyl-ACP methyl ester carboxylesterase
MKKLPLFFFFAFLFLELNAQCPDFISVSSQEALESLMSQYPDCQNIAGNVQISDRVSNLAPLSNVRTIGGRLSLFRDSMLTSLSGLENLTSVGGDLRIETSPLVTDISGLANLTSVGEDFDVNSMQGLTGSDWFEGLQSIEGDFRIFNCNGMQSLTGFSSLTTIGGKLTFSTNLNLKVIDVMPNLVSIGNELGSCCHDSLTTIRGFESLETVSGDVFFRFEENLKFIECLNNIKTVGGGIQVWVDAPLQMDNVELINGNITVLGSTHLIGFNNLTTVLGEIFLNEADLKEISNFSSLQSIGGSLTLIGSDSIKNLNAFPVLETIGGELSITRNERLASITGFHTLTSVGQDFLLQTCDSLTSVIGFEMLSEIGGNLRIQQNRSLQICDAFCHVIENGTIGGNIQIFINGPQNLCRYSQGELLSCNIEQIIDKVYDANPKIYKLQFPDITDPADLSPIQINQLVTEREAIAADGVSQLIFQLKFDESTTFSIQGSGFDLPWGNQTTEISGFHYGFSRYTAPAYFDRTNPITTENGIAQYEHNFQVNYNNGSESAAGSIVIVPPPVVLVHGTYSNPTTWTMKVEGQQSMQEAIEAAGYRVFTVDYESTNGSGDPSSFSHNYKVVWENAGGILDALTNYQSTLDAAVAQADVIGHSLGGIIPRIYVSDHYNPLGYRRADNFMDGDINRLITIGSTHHGSHLGELQQFLKNGSPLQFGIPGWFSAQAATLLGSWVGGSAPSQAVNDQKPESDALEFIGRTEVPAHAITCKAPINKLKDPVYDPDESYYSLFKYLSLLLYYNGAVSDAYLDKKLALCERDLKAGTTKEGISGEDLYAGLTDEQIFKQMFEDGLDRNADELEAIDGDLMLPQNIERFDFAFGETEMSYFDDPMLDIFKPDEEPISIPDTLYQNLHMPEVVNLEPKYEQVEALRSLIFNHDDNDGVVRVESQSGEIEKECENCVTNLNEVLHSFAPQYPIVQQRIVQLLNGGMTNFNMDGFPPAGNGQLLYYPPSRMDFYRVPKTGIDAICASGMVASHATQYARIADQEDVVVMVRPVNPDATTLISGGAATKEMDVKPKSSNWGPQRGYLPFKQRYSKLWKIFKGKERDDKIQDYDIKAMENITSGITLKRQLSVTVCHKEFLVFIDQGKIEGPTDNNAEDEVVLVPVSNQMEVCHWGSTYDPSKPIKNCEPRTNDHQLVPFEVMATPRKFEEDGKTPRFLTADYDLLMVGFNEGEDLEYNPPTNIPLKPGVGQITDEQEALVAKLNQAVEDYTEYTGGELTHHGPENQFGKSPYVDYPITVFMPDDVENGFFNGPKGKVLSIDMGPNGFRDIHLKRFINRMREKGYDLYDNTDAPGWQWTWNDGIEGFELTDSPMLGDYVDQLPTNKCDKAGAPLSSTCMVELTASNEEQSFADWLFGNRSTYHPFRVHLATNLVRNGHLQLYIESDQTQDAKIRISNELGQLLIHQQINVPAGESQSFIDISTFGAGIYFFYVEGEKPIAFIKL